MHLINIISKRTKILFKRKDHVKMTSANLIELAKTRPVNFDLAKAKKSDVNFQLFTKKHQDGLYLSDESIQSSGVDVSIPTKIFIHGWNSNLKSNWYNAFKDEYLKRGNHNVIYVDWFEAGCKEYPISSANVKPVGHYIGEFIVASKVHLENVHVIGKSLGAHVASYVGKRVQELTGNKLRRITGLDPASPKFENDEVPETSRLNNTDAEFVDVIHTDAGYFGFKKPLGTVDFYPNGGGLQPGCDNDEAGHHESHGRSNWYFLESINSRNTKAWKADSWDDFLKGKFVDENSVVFGEDVPESASGTYFFKTSASKPYITNE